MSITPKVQATYPQVTPKQEHTAWTQMSKMLWKRDKMQIPSEKLLLEELGDEVDLFNIQPPEGVKQMAWGIKPILRRLWEVGTSPLDQWDNPTIPKHSSQMSYIKPMAHPHHLYGGFLASIR